MEHDFNLPDEKPVHVGKEQYPEPTYSTPISAIPTSEAETDITHLREYWKIMLARRYSILAIVATVVLFVLISTFKETPVYRATAQVQIDRENAKVLSFDNIYELEAGDDDSLQTQFKILGSRNLAKRVVQALHLDKKTENAPPKESLVSQARSRVRAMASSVLHGLLSQKKTDSSETPAEDTELRRVVDGYQGSLRIIPVARTRLANISFESSNPQLAAQIVNAHAEQFIQLNLQSRFDATQVASEFLDTELQAMKAKLEQAEEGLRAYSQAHSIIFVDEGKGDGAAKNTEMAILAQLQSNYTKAQTDRIEKESYARQMRAQGGAEDPTKALLNGQFAGKLIDLRRQDSDLAVSFAPDWPARQRLRGQIAELEKAVQDEKVQTVARAEAEYAGALDRERMLSRELDKQKDIVNNINKEGVQYSILKHETDSNRQLYDVLLTRRKEAGISSGLKPSNIRITDRAEIPTTPVRPDKMQNLMWAVIIGLSLGLGFAFFQEYMDNSLKTPEDVTKYLRLPTLAIIPKLQSIGRKGKYGYYMQYAYSNRKKKPAGAVAEPTKAHSLEMVTQNEPSTVLSESYRSLRASLILSAPDRPPRTILVSSAVPSEGKTATTTNLAITLTQIGSRVLVIDADMRKPRIGSIFGLKHSPGLSSFLTGSEPLKSVIHPTQIPNMYVMPCGAIPPNPSELLMSSRFRQMIKTLRSYFDYVVIDSPPLNNVSDGRIIATSAEGIVFVTKASTTARNLAMRAIEHLDESKGRVLGVVLNDYDLHRMSSYYYLYYSGRYHSYYSYYSSDDKKQIANS